MRTIIFFNHCHNGDLIVSKEFVRELMRKVPANYIYAHTKSPNLLKDMIGRTTDDDYNRTSGSIGKYPKKFVFPLPNVTVINTWWGAYYKEWEVNENFYDVVSPSFSKIDLNWEVYYEIFEYIFKVCARHFDMDLTLDEKSPIEYAHKIDYSLFSLPEIKLTTKKSVYFANGLPMSGQSHLYNDMSEHIIYFAERLPNITFYCSQKFFTILPNIVFTDDIFNRPFDDLNETAYLSQLCNGIVGRNSGTFHITNTKHNLNDPNKHLLVFGNHEGHCFPYNLKFPANFTFVEDINEHVVRQALANLLTKIIFD